jgi:hypothetical protein
VLSWSSRRHIEGPANASIQNNSGLPQGLAGHSAAGWKHAVDRPQGAIGCWWSLLGGRKTHVPHEAPRVHHAAWRRGRSASCPAVPMTSSIRRAKFTGSGLSSSLPASILGTLAWPAPHRRCRHPLTLPYSPTRARNVDRYGFAGLAQARAQSGPPRSEEAHGSPTLLWLSDIARQAAMCCARPTITRPGGSMSAALELRSQA